MENGTLLKHERNVILFEKLPSIVYPLFIYSLRQLLNKK